MKIIIINGPNLNMLGRRDPIHYGSLTLDEINQLIIDKYPNLNFEFYQSNCEGEIINLIQNSFDFHGLIINAGAYTHTSIAIRDALEILDIPKVSVHLSNYLKRETFRKVDFMKEVVDKVFYGKQINSYYEAIEFIIDKLRR